MKLSIVIPVYNAEKYIEECLASILPEMDDDMELLLIDDGSKDSSYLLIQKYKKENIRVFHHENHGVSCTRNVGIVEARGDYIQFVDADDRLSPGWKNVVLSGCAEAADVVYYSKNFDEQGNVDKTNIIHGIFGIPDPKCDANMSSPCSKLYRREFLLKNQIRFDGGLINGEDGIFNLNVILKAERFVCYKASYYQYRIYMGSSSKKYSDKFYDSNLRYFSLAETLLKDNNVEDSEITRCMSYAVTYSVYLYLFLISTSESKVHERGEKYTLKYPISKDCNKIIQIICFLVRNRKEKIAMMIVRCRNFIRKYQRCEVRWENI